VGDEVELTLSGGKKTFDIEEVKYVEIILE
jgi:transcription elongation GreA/GreB family factor